MGKKVRDGKIIISQQHCQERSALCQHEEGRTNNN